MSIEDKIKKGQQEMTDDGVDWNKKFNQLEQQLDVPIDSKSNFFLKNKLIWLSIVAGMVLFAIWYFTKPSNTSAQELFIAHYEIAPPVFESAQRGAEAQNNTNDRWKGQQAYLNNDYVAAKKHWKSALINSPDDEELKTFIGVTSLELDQADEAMSMLKGINDPMYQDIASWYLALSQIKASQIPEARSTLLTIIENNSHYKHSSATTLLEKIEKLR